MFWHVPPWVYAVWGSLHFLDLGDYFFSHVREVFSYNLFKYFLNPFLFLLFFWDTYSLNVGAFNVVPEISETVLISVHSFFIYSVPWQRFPPFCLQVTYPFFCLSILLLSPSTIFFISVVVLFISVCLFFFSSRSLLNFSCISQSMPPFFFEILDHLYYHYSEFFFR